FPSGARPESARPGFDADRGRAATRRVAIVPERIRGRDARGRTEAPEGPRQTSSEALGTITRSDGGRRPCDAFVLRPADARRARSTPDPPRPRAQASPPQGHAQRHPGREESALSRLDARRQGRLLVARRSPWRRTAYAGVAARGPRRFRRGRAGTRIA